MKMRFMIDPRSLSVILGLVIAGHCCDTPRIDVPMGQINTEIDTGEASKYIADVFRLAFGSAPQLGWILHDGTVLATQTPAAEITVLSSAPDVVVASRHLLIPPADSDL